MSSSAEEEGYDAAARGGPVAQSLQGEYCQQLYTKILTQQGAKRLATNYVHSPMTWHKAWKEIEINAEYAPEGLLFAKKMIWEQTLLTIQNNNTHMQLRDLFMTSPPQIVNRSSLVGVQTKSGKRLDTKVRNADCLSIAGDMASVGFDRIAVLMNANSRSPGGGVRRGSGAQEEEMFRRTDMVRHTAQYESAATHYPLNTDEPTAMFFNDVTIFRGPESEGYPF